jgi:hypothetical protein
MKLCKVCGETKDELLFPQYRGKAQGRTCTVCNNEWQKQYHQDNKVRINEERRDARQGPVGKARSVLNSMKGSSKTLGFEPPEFTLNDVVEVCAYGSCAVTGLPFVLDYKGQGIRNPLSPSPDRINPKLGYTKENVQWVCWMYNLMKGDHGQEDVDRFMDAIVRKRDARNAIAGR